MGSKTKLYLANYEVYLERRYEIIERSKGETCPPEQ